MMNSGNCNQLKKRYLSEFLKYLIVYKIDKY